MTIPDERELLDRALEVQAKVNERVQAILTLGEAGSDAAVSVLLELGSRASEPAEVLKAVGHSLAAMAARTMQVTEFDMRDLSAVSYDAFCKYGA